MRRWSMVLGGACLWMLAGCGEQPPCGVDDDGDDIPSCNYNGALYCPLDNWIADDGCNTCGCSPEGELACNDRVECQDPTLPTGSSPTGE